MGWKIFFCYLFLINLITFLAFAADKIKAKLNLWRIKEATLLFLSFIGGTAGGLIAMHVCRHKVRKPRFAFGVPFMLVVQVLVVLLIGGVI